MLSSSPHALITGAAKRVGREIALHLANHGYDLTLHYHRSEDEAKSLYTEITALGRICRLVQADLSTPHVTSTVFTTAEAHSPMSPVTLLIHNAALFERDTLETATYEQLDAHMRVNLYSPMLLTQAFSAQLPKETKGHVIALTDGLHGWSLSPSFLSYSMSKLALEQFVRLMASRLAPHIRINTVAMGATLAAHEKDANTFLKTQSMTPLQCNSSPQEVCDIIIALEKLSSVTGQIFYLSSGLHS